MSNTRYPEEFRIEAAKQATERGYRVAEVASRLGVSIYSVHAWIKAYGDGITPEKFEKQYSNRPRGVYCQSDSAKTSWEISRECRLPCFDARHVR